MTLAYRSFIFYRSKALFKINYSPVTISVKKIFYTFFDLFLICSSRLKAKVPQQLQVATKTVAIVTTTIIILHLIGIKTDHHHITIDQNDPHIIEVAITIAENVIMLVFSAKSETNIIRHHHHLQAAVLILVRAIALLIHVQVLKTVSSTSMDVLCGLKLIPMEKEKSSICGMMKFQD